MALSNFVGKYMQAFLVVAEESTSRQSPDGKSNSETDDDDNNNNKDLRKNAVVPIPRGLNRMVLDRFAACWRTLRTVQHNDAHPVIAKAANTLVSVVHEQLLDARMENEREEKAREEEEKGLSGIEEEGGGVDIERLQSDRHLLASVDAKGQQSSKNPPHSEGARHRLPGTKSYPLRRTASEHSSMMQSDSISDSRTSALLSPRGIPPLPDPSGGPSRLHKKEYSLPKSKFYQWKKESFKSNYGDSDDDDLEDRDPLNPLGAARAYQDHRNAAVDEIGRKLASHYEGLKPKPPKKKKAWEISLDSDEEADEKDSSLKGELKLRESKLLRNTGIKMTSMLKFHSYEDVLMVCDNQDGLSIWDYEKGNRNLSFKNGNPKGSRMTNAFWINESSTSLFFVGCDDGSARIWNGIVESNGEVSSQSPSLSSAFFAVPDMEAGQRGSGLICEWQQFSGSLFAGGNSNCIRCWDLSAEQCGTILETNTEACVTALTTAWDEDLGVMPGGYHGMGPDVLVAGHSDGSLKVFDIRSSGAVAVNSGRTRRSSSFTEHRSWIVDTSFTSYGGRFEIISGSVAGDIRAWDLRMSSSLRTLDVQRSPMTALAIHKQIPIVACGSHAQFIKILTLEGEALQVVRFHEELQGHRIGPVSCLEFHKQKLVLAAGATNSLVSIYKPKHPSSL
jgi:regulator-associated protein of mTOR